MSQEIKEKSTINPIHKLDQKKNQHSKGTVPCFLSGKYVSKSLRLYLIFLRRSGSA